MNKANKLENLKEKPFLWQSGPALQLRVLVTPGSRRNRILGAHGDCLKISVRGKAIDGQANQTLVEFLAETLEIKPSAITLLSGHSARLKVLSLNGIILEECETKLASTG